MSIIKNIVLNIAVGALRLMDSAIRSNVVCGNKVLIMSRQSDEPSEDIRMLTERLSAENPELDVTVMTAAIRGPGYAGHVLKQARAMSQAHVVLVDGYNIPVSVLRHNENTKVIQLWHSLAAVKKFGLAALGTPGGRDADTARIMKMHEGYDYVLCPGEGTAGFFCEGFGVDRDKLLYIGLPRIDRMLDGTCPESEIEERLSIDRSRRNVLYAPTFRRERQIGDELEKLVQAFKGKDIDLIIKLHPLDGTDEEKLLEKYENVRSGRGIDTYDLMKYCDCIVTDYSAVGVEASIMQKPVYFYVFDLEEYSRSPGLNMDLKKEAGKFAVTDAEELASLIDEEYDMEFLRAFRDKYITVDTDDCTGQLCRFISGLTMKRDENDSEN